MSDAAESEIPIEAVAPAEPGPEPEPPSPPKPYPGFWQAVWLLARFMLYLMAFLIPFGIADAIWKTHLTLHPGINAAAYLGAAILSIWHVCVRQQASLRLIAGPLPSPTVLPPILLANVALLMIYVPLIQWTARLFPKLMEGQSDYGVTESWWGAFVYVVIVAPPVEETLFRGIIARGFDARYGAMRAILFSALLFGGMHFSILKLIPTVALGMFTASLVLRFDSIWPGVFAHLVNNLLGFLPSLLTPASTTPKVSDVGHFTWYEPAACLAGALLLAVALTFLLRQSRTPRLDPRLEHAESCTLT